MVTHDGWTKSTCAYCGVGCGIEARVLGSGKLEVRGDKSHPANFGKLCTKGIALGDTVIEDGRLLYPQQRVAGKWQRVAWDEALTTVADKFTQTIAEYGPDSVAFYVSGQLLTEDYYVANKLMKGFIGSSNIDSNSRLCMASSVVGHKRAFGMDSVPVVYEDLEQAEVVILVGSNLAWCHPVLYQRLRVAKENNPELKVLVVDPRRNESCDIADQHLPIHSGSDVALFNGLLRYLADHQALDMEFITKHTNQFEAALAAAQQETNTQDVTGLSSGELEQFYRVFAEHKRVVTIYSQGVNQSTQGSDKVNSIINCHLASGKIGYAGCGPFSVTGQPNAMGGREVGALASTLAAHMEFDQPQEMAAIREFWHTDSLASKPGLKAVDMFDAVAEGKIKAIWIMATNPVVSLPNSDKIKTALENCPFVVISDCIADTATTRCADLLLPAQGWSEKSGTVTNSERRISRQRKLLASPGQAKPDWWIVSQVAQRMGFKEQFDYHHEGEVFREYAAMTGLNQHVKPRDLNLIGLAKLTDQEYHHLMPQQWPVLEYQSELVNQRLFTDKQFYTANGKANFLAVSHRVPQRQISTQYPLLLNTGRTRDHWHTMTRTGLSTRLASFHGDPYLMIHPDTAQQYQLNDGHIATVSNQQGKVRAKVMFNDGMKRGELFMPIHWNELTAADAKPCSLVDPRVDAYSGQPEFKCTPVEIAPEPTPNSVVVATENPLTLGRSDYWSRQKIAGGYLYHIRSGREVAQILSELPKQEGDEVSYRSGSWHFKATRQGAKTVRLVVVSTVANFTSEHVSDVAELFAQTEEVMSTQQRFYWLEQRW